MKKLSSIKPLNFVAKDLVTSKKYKMRVVASKVKYKRSPKHKGASYAI